MASAATPDKTLIEAARSGDRDALEKLLARYQPRVYRFGMRMCRHPEDAEDVLQETLLAMTRSLRDFRGASSVGTWLFAIARSFCIKKRRKRKAQPEREVSLDSDRNQAAAEPADDGRGVDDEVEARRMVDALERAIDALEPKYREVLLLRDVEGMTAPEVAEVLGLKVPAIKSRLHRARLAVREQLAPLVRDGARPPATDSDCPDIVALFSRHLEGEIDDELCAQMERHLQRCVPCKGDCDSLKQTLALCRRAPAPGVPPEVQRAVKRAIRAYLDA